MTSIFECSLKIKDFSAIPMYEELVDELLYLMLVPEFETKIKGWMSRANIEIINYDPNFHEFKPSNEIVLELFWYVVQKITEKSEENKLHFYRNLVLNSVNEVNPNPTEMRNYFMLISKLSETHLKVLRLIDGVIDYYAHLRIAPPNTILDTLNTLDKNIEFTIPELRGQYEKITIIWNDLLESGLRKEESLYLRMTEKRLAWFSMTSDFGKKFLGFVSPR